VPRLYNSIYKSCAAAFVVVLSLTLPAVGQVDVKNFSNIKIQNFGQIDANYYRGSQPRIDDLTNLAKLGVRTVIDLTNGDGDSNEKLNVEKAGMKYCQIPMTTHKEPTTEKIAEFLRIVNDPAQQPVYVHCVGGRHRTGVMTAIYRMTQSKWSAAEAFQEMKQFKFGMDFLHPEFKNFVFSYYNQLAQTPAVPSQINGSVAEAAVAAANQ
jgi:protein tyrosine/serine phosphatase